MRGALFAPRVLSIPREDACGADHAIAPSADGSPPQMIGEPADLG